ncbi:MAG TPA: 4-alpha-glucanotransferase [Sunxiuqinia sp.]|nr:4-alpha-glucanotransferase [Sunxiuqinia sp.]
MTRSSGILLHVSSLPGEFGIGNMGEDAFAFVDFLSESNQKLWQILPLGPTGYGNSPYQSYSAFAGSPLLISMKKLVQEGLLFDRELLNHQAFSETEVEYEEVEPVKIALLQRAFVRFQEQFIHFKEAYYHFLGEHSWWLNDYALFQALKEENELMIWNEWEDEFKKRDGHVLDRIYHEHADSINFHRFVQFIFFKQWFELKEYANEKDVQLVGDLPLYVSYDSSEVWANQDIFQLDKKGAMTHVGGVPPDYFSETGQLWGCPVFDWDRLEERQFDWWVARVHFCLNMFDLIRIDHFRGLESFWSVAADEQTAINGKWVPAKGRELFQLLQSQIGDLPVIAEDLGIITPAVEQLRLDFNFPGMKVLQFGYSSDETNEHLPHNFHTDTVVYTGTHDNDTTVGWLKSTTVAERKNLKAYFPISIRKMPEKMIELAWSSVATMAIMPLQDLLGLDSQSRMNIPGTTHGNWEWRFRWSQLKPMHLDYLNKITRLYNR